MGEILKKRLKQKSFESSEQEAILNLLVAANYIRARIDLLCAEFKLTRSQYNVLRILKGALPGGYSRREIISRMIEPSPDVTRLIDRLVNEEFVERYLSDSDRRLSCARITKKGSGLLSKLNPRISQFISDYSEPLKKSEREKLSFLCERLYAQELKK